MFFLILFFPVFYFSADVPVKVEKCISENTYYDVSSMTCITCSSSLFLIPDSSKRSCICDEGRFKKYSTARDGSFTCELCAYASSRDRLRCQGCENGTTTFNSVTKDCECVNVDWQLVEFGIDGNYLDNKTCRTCLYYQSVDSEDKYSCVDRCDQSEIWGGTSCSCLHGTTNYVETGSGCVLRNNDVANFEGSIQVTQIKEKTSSGESSEYYVSPFLKRVFLENVASCLGGKDPVACNAIANLCVLNLYDDGKICSAYRSGYNSMTNPNVYGGNVYSGWKMGYPWLEYSENQREVILKDEEAFKSDLGFIASKVKRLNFVLSRFTVEGVWLGYKTMTTELLQCFNEEEDEARYLRIGTNIKKSCNLNVNKLRYLPQTEIWELFVGDPEIESLKPVPVQIISANEEGISYKYYHRSDNTIKLFRRFFMYDNVVLPDEYIRFVSHARLQVTIRSGTQSMFIPFLTLRYSARKVNEITDEELIENNLNYTSLTSSNIGSPKVTFEVEYDQNQLAFYIVVISLSAFLLLIGEFISIFNCYLYLTKRYERQFRFPVLGKLLSETCGNSANSLCCGLVLFTFWYFFFFKLQALVFIMIPTSVQNITFYIVVPITMLLKLFNICYVNYEDTHYDIFFVDWEDPQGTALIVDHVAKEQHKHMQGMKFAVDQEEELEGEGEVGLPSQERELEDQGDMNTSKVVVDGYMASDAESGNDRFSGSGMEMVDSSRGGGGGGGIEEEVSIHSPSGSVNRVDEGGYTSASELEEGGLYVSDDAGGGGSGTASDGGGSGDNYFTESATGGGGGGGGSRSGGEGSGLYVSETVNPSDDLYDRPPSARASQDFGQAGTGAGTVLPKKKKGRVVSNRDPLTKTPVSHWRTHLVANEFLSLCNEGYVNLEFTLIVVCFFLSGLKLSNLAYETHDGILGFRDDMTTNPVLRFTISTLFFVFVGLLQYCYKRCFHYRFVRDPVRNFVDLCVTTNVSVFILPELYYGYYIHGQAPYKYADTDLYHYGNYIEQERNHTFPERGLTPEGRSRGCVCFEVYVSPTLRKVFDGFANERSRGLADRRRRATEIIFNPAKNVKKVNVNVMDIGTSGIRFYRLFYPENSSQMMKQLFIKYVECNDVLRQMIKNLKNDSQRVVSRDLSHRCGFPPSSQLRNTKKSVFIKDSGGDMWSKVLVRGNEWKFLSFYIILFSCFDMFIKNPVVSSLIVYVMYRLIRCTRYWMSFRNLQKKTLLDSRFFL